MSKITLANLANLQNETTAVNTINSNSSIIQTAWDNTLSRDGTSPNQMGASLDMNSNRILNLPLPISGTEPLRLTDANTLNGGGTIQSIPSGGLTGQSLTKLSNASYDAGWVGVGSTAISLKDYGVVADGVTNDTAAFNLAIAYANLHAGTCFRVPVGTILLSGAVTAITANNIFFIGEGAPQDCVIKCTNATGLAWSTASSVVDGGGTLNVGFDGDGTAGRTTINLPNAARIRFENVWFSTGIATLFTLGSAAHTTSQISIAKLRGYCANTADPLLSMVNGSGLAATEHDVSVNTTDYTTVTTGRSYALFSSQSWDTATFTNCIVQKFYSPISVVTASGKIHQSIWVANSIFDGNKLGVELQATGTIYAARIVDSLISCPGAGAIGINLSGAGNIYGCHFAGNRIQQVLASGISLSATTFLTNISNNHIHGVNQAASTNDGIVVAAGAFELNINENQIGDTAAGIPGTPRYGINIGNCSKITLIGNICNGSTAGFNLGTLTSSKVRGNTGYTAGTLDTTGKDQPVFTVAEGGTGLASGTSGGIPYFSSSTALTSSAALAANAIVVGGGAGVAPLTPATTPPTVSSTGVVNVVNATDSLASVGTGSLITAGGLAVVKSATVGNNINVGGTTLGAAGTHNFEIFSGTTTGNSAALVFGQDAGHGMTMLWNANTTPGSASGSIRTVNDANHITIDGGNGGGGDGVFINANTNRPVTTGTGAIVAGGNVGAAGSILSSSATLGVGYKTGAGGIVTQGTSRVTAVTLNKVCGQITMFNAAGSASPASFTVNNTAIGTADTVTLSIASGATNVYVLSVTTITNATSFVITYYTTGGTAADAPVINFTIHKGVTS